MRDPPKGQEIPAEPKSGALTGTPPDANGAAVDPALERSGRIRVGVEPPAGTPGGSAVAPVDSITRDLTTRERELLGDLLAVIGEHDSGNGDAVDQKVVAKTGEVVEVNESVVDSPESVNADPYGAGWLFTVRAESVPELLDADAYAALIQEG